MHARFALRWIASHNFPTWIGSGCMPLYVWTRDGTGSRVTGSPGQRFWPGRIGSRVSVSDPVFDLVLSFNIFGVISTEYHHLGIIYVPNFMPSSLKAHILTIYCFLVNLFKLFPVIFTSLRAHCRGFVSKLSATGSGHRVNSRRVLTRFHLWCELMMWQKQLKTDFITIFDDWNRIRWKKSFNCNCNLNRNLTVLLQSDLIIMCFSVNCWFFSVRPL